MPHPLPISALLLLVIELASTCGRASDVPFLSDTLVRKDQLQHVLEHEPAQKASCEQTVRPPPFSPWQRLF